MNITQWIPAWIIVCAVCVLLVIVIMLTSTYWKTAGVYASGYLDVDGHGVFPSVRVPGRTPSTKVALRHYQNALWLVQQMEEGLLNVPTTQAATIVMHHLASIIWLCNQDNWQGALRELVPPSAPDVDTLLDRLKTQLNAQERKMVDEMVEGTLHEKLARGLPYIDESGDVTGGATTG
jgi:hypothetical protein